jgi:FMN-dependent NADH-azoreductase
MRLIALNGSPRGAASNTNLLVTRFLEGFSRSAGNSAETVHLKAQIHPQQALDAFLRAETLLIAFPLYADAMPGLVKEYIEELKPWCGRGGNPALLFLVQSGFPEGSHTRHLEPYLEKLTRRLGCRYLGTIRKGGVEGIRSQPEVMTRNILNRMRDLGESFGRTGVLDRDGCAALAGPDRLGRVALLAVGVMSRFLFWNPQLRTNGAFQQRFARPLQDR